MRRRIAIALGLTLAGGLAFAGVALAEYQGSDVWGSVSPTGPVVAGAERLINAYPLGRYSLDSHVDTGLSNLGGFIGALLHGMANLLWSVTRMMAFLAIQLLVWAFGLDLLTGAGIPGANGANGAGGGVLEPLSRAIIDMYQSTFGRAWLLAAITASGLWAMWTAMVRLEHRRTLSGLGTSVIFVAVALLFVLWPQSTIGSLNGFTNGLTRELMQVADGPGGRGGGAVADRLFRLTVHDPWTVLNFGGLKHCVTETGRPQAGGPRCIDNQVPQGAHGGYTARYLAFPAGSEERAREYKWIKDADAPANGAIGPGEQPDNRAQLEAAAEYAGVPVGRLPAMTRAAFRDEYRPNVLDRPAVDIQQEGGAGDRLMVSVLIFVGNLGVALLVGGIALGIILAQLLLLVFAGLSPFAMVAAALPGRGHDFFRLWAGQMILWFTRKVVYALVLVVILAVAGALQAGTAGTPWLVGYGLVVAFFWILLAKRDSITDMFSRLSAVNRDTPGGTELSGRERRIAYAPISMAAGGAYLSARALARDAQASGETAPGPGTRAAHAIWREAGLRYSQGWSRRHSPPEPGEGGDTGTGPAGPNGRPGGNGSPAGRAAGALPAPAGPAAAAGAPSSSANGAGHLPGANGAPPNGAAPPPGAGAGAGGARAHYEPGHDAPESAEEWPEPPWMRRPQAQPAPADHAAPERPRPSGPEPGRAARRWEGAPPAGGEGKEPPPPPAPAEGSGGEASERRRRRPPDEAEPG